MNFKKITAIATSVLMTGMTVGMAAAATYPAPFVDNGVANVAVVYGTGVGVSSLDMVQAGNIQTSLGSFVKGTTTVEGESYKLEKTSTKFNLGDSIADVVSATIDDDELPTLLEAGIYTDKDNDEFDYTQKVVLANLTLNMWEDNDYKADVPTVGFRIANGANVLNYTVDFTDEPEWTDLETSTLPLMGREYYVLDASAVVGTSITLLDSAMSTILSEGETVTVSGKQVSIEFIGDNTVKFEVDGELTNSLAEGQTFKLSDGSYLGVKDVLYSSKDAGISKVEFSIGSGKLLLTSGSDVQLNEDTISDLSVTITNSSSQLSSIVLQWDAEDDLFVAEDSIVTMPGFEALSLSFTGLTYPTEESFGVEADGDVALVLKSLPLKDSTEDINFLAKDVASATASTNYTLIGKDSDNLLRTGTVNVTFDGDTDDWFLASWSDGSDAESYLMQATNFKNESGKQMATFQYRKDGAWADLKVDAEATDTISIGNVELTVGAIDKDAKTAAVTDGGSANIDFFNLYSKEGMRVILPTSINASTYSLVLSEEDKNGNIADGQNVTLTLGENANYESSVTAVTPTLGGTFTEVDDTDMYTNFIYSELATEMSWDKSGDQYKLTMVYHGDEVMGGVYLASSDAVMSGASALGDVLVKDSEVATVATKNLVIVGGSCINSAAAKVLGVSEHTCGEAFTAATGVGAGEFLIKGVQDAYTTGKLALVVAGYDAADTANAATYLTMKVVDTSKEYKGTSETTAEVVVA